MTSHYIICMENLMINDSGIFECFVILMANCTYILGFFYLFFLEQQKKDTLWSNIIFTAVCVLFFSPFCWCCVYNIRINYIYGYITIELYIMFIYIATKQSYRSSYECINNKLYRKKRKRWKKSMFGDWLVTFILINHILLKRSK